MDGEVFKEFERKCRDGTLTCRDKRKIYLNMFEKIGVRFDKKSQKGLEEYLKLALHNLKGGSEVGHVVAHDILTCMSPLLNIDEQTYQDYMDKFNKYMQKHERECAFKRNYKTE
jgi:hypothetical protein